MERETGIEPATNSLEGCDSTTELLPPSLTARYARNFGGQARFSSTLALACHPKLATRAKNGGEGRIRTFEAAGATDLQSVAFDRFATSPEIYSPALAPADTALPGSPTPGTARSDRHQIERKSSL